MIYCKITPSFVNVARYVKKKDTYTVYERIMELTDNNHLEAANAESWCELACVGETYEGSCFTIEIIEDEE